jgi:threonyl-tRNA synthetase
LVVGEKEEAENTVSVRRQGDGDLGSMSIEAFAGLIQKEIDSRLVAFEIN